MVNTKHAFWQALVLAIIVFGIGLLLGVFLEGSRENSIEYSLLDSEINILDDQLRNIIAEDFSVSCDLALKSTFDFADKIYFEAAKLEQYDGASKFSDYLLILHRRYDLLRTLLWTEAVKLKEKCKDYPEGDFHIVVYLYKYNVEDFDIDSRQLFFSRLLFDLKVKYPEKVILIPIAANTNLTSIDLITDNFEIKDFPVIIIDEEEIVDEIITFEDLENIVFENNNEFKLASGL